MDHVSILRRNGADIPLRDTSVLAATEAEFVSQLNGLVLRDSRFAITSAPGTFVSRVAIGDEQRDIRDSRFGSGAQLSTPSVPTSITVPGSAASSATITVSWAASTTVLGVPVTYRLERSTNNGASWVLVAQGISGTSTTNQVPAGPASVVYRVRSETHNGVLVSGWRTSNQVSVLAPIMHMSVARGDVSAATDGNNFALLAGGSMRYAGAFINTTTNLVERLSPQRTLTTLTPLAVSRVSIGGMAVSNSLGSVVVQSGWGLPWAPGVMPTPTPAAGNAIDIYNSSGTRTFTSAPIGDTGRTDYTPASMGSDVFGVRGTVLTSAGVATIYGHDTIRRITAAGTVNNAFSSIPVQQSGAAAEEQTTTRMLVAGGGMLVTTGGIWASIVWSSDVRSVLSTAAVSLVAQLSIARTGCGSARDGADNVLFAGGSGGNLSRPTVDRFNTASARTTLTELPVAGSARGVRVGNNAVFCTTSTNSGSVVQYNTAGTRSAFGTVSFNRHGVAIVRFGTANVAIVGGGLISSSLPHSNVIDIL